MIQTVEMKKIYALNGAVVLELEECQDGFLNIRVRTGDDRVRIGLEGPRSIFFKILRELAAKQGGKL